MIIKLQRISDKEIIERECESVRKNYFGNIQLVIAPGRTLTFQSSLWRVYNGA